ncbi:MAG: hypothetical protein GXO22_00440 [Aquificae bacterium]|nr:hypothetical protein [Aquificota bacterium]
MKKKFVLAGASLLTFGLLSLHQTEGIKLKKAFADQPFISGIEAHLQIRPRYEYVDVENSPNKDANALTVRTAITTKLKSLFGIKGFNGIIEAANVGAIIDDYSPQKPNYELVPDPPITRFSQFAVTYTKNKTTFIGGRVYVTIDDHRFIGNVPWRQMYQSFGVLAVSTKAVKNFNLLLAGIYERKGIIDDLNADWRLDKMPLVLDINYSAHKSLRLKAFAYMITDVHDTFGLKASGKVKLGKVKLSYLGEYAKQDSPYALDNLPANPNIDANYYRLSLGSVSGGFFGNIMYTHFDGRDTGEDKGFSTPLATLHKFEGWSDVLLLGAANGFDYGLNEVGLTLGYKKPDLGNLMLIYLIFKSDMNPTDPTVGKDIGKELDVQYTKKLTPHLSFLAKAAFYRADDGYYTGGTLKGTQDVKKYWLQLNYLY